MHISRVRGGFLYQRESPAKPPNSLSKYAAEHFSVEETPYVLDWKKGSDDCYGTRNDSCFGWMRGRTFVDCVSVEYPLMR